MFMIRLNVKIYALTFFITSAVWLLVTPEFAFFANPERELCLKIE